MSNLEGILWLIGIVILYAFLSWQFYKSERESYNCPQGHTAYFLSGGLFIATFVTMFIVVVLLLLRYLIFGGG